MNLVILEKELVCDILFVSLIIWYQIMLRYSVVVYYGLLVTIPALVIAL